MKLNLKPNTLYLGLSTLYLTSHTVCAQCMDAELAHLSMEEIGMWVELNLKLTRRTPLNGETSYEYHITPMGLRAHNLNTVNEAGRLNTRGPPRCVSVRRVGWGARLYGRRGAKLALRDEGCGMDGGDEAVWAR